MAKVNKQTARTDIYKRGLRTPADNKQRYNLDRSKPADENDSVIVKKGEDYYSWTLHGQAKQISKFYPKPQQLTQSAFLIASYDIQDKLNDLSAGNYSDPSELESDRDDIVSDLEELRDVTQESLENMPEGLQQGSTGELLQERIDACEEFIDELNGVDLSDYEELTDEEIEAELEAEFDPETQRRLTPYEMENIDEDKVIEFNENRRAEHLQEWLQEKIDELQAITMNA